ncbi:MAG TPA: phosphatase PAP2 family protein [Burkholderiaceae bacterium]|nr:phosphatase PAP2 family protein [Burkholderiaceae bacterium]
MGLFFVGYFQLLRHPLRPPLQMPLTAIDHWIDLRAWALWPYVSLWVYVTLPPLLMSNARELIRYGWWIGALCVTGLASFYWWPTAVPPTTLPAGAPGFDLLRGVDASGNACPSMHVATATFSALWLDRLLRELALPPWLRWASIGWFALIVWSTLAVKQHVWWDVVAGLLLALAVGLLSLRFVDTAIESAPIEGGER